MVLSGLDWMREADKGRGREGGREERSSARGAKSRAGLVVWGNEGGRELRRAQAGGRAQVRRELTIGEMKSRVHSFDGKEEGWPAMGKEDGMGHGTVGLRETLQGGLPVSVSQRVMFGAAGTSGGGHGEHLTVFGERAHPLSPSPSRERVPIARMYQQTRSAACCEALA